MTESKNVLVLLADGTEEMEFAISVDIFRRAGMKVTAVGVNLENNYAECSRQVKIVPDAILDEKNWEPREYDAIIIPGGAAGASTMARDTKVNKLVHSFYEEKRIVAFICAGTLVAKSAEIGQHHTVTSYPSVRNKLEDYFKYSEDRVVVDDNVITSRGPGTAFLFALTIVEQLCGKECSDKLKKDMLALENL